MGRILTQKLAETTGRPFPVENRSGANGNIGTELAAKAPKDGYTLLFTGAGLVTNPGLYDKVIELKRRAEAAGRDPASINVTVYFAPATEDAVAEMERCAVDRAVFLLPCVEPAELMPVIDRYASLVRATSAKG